MSSGGSGGHRGSTHMEMCCNDTIFRVRKGLLLEKLKLFLTNPSLLRESEYRVRSVVPTEAFAEFVKALQDEPFAVTEDNLDGLVRLAGEFEFRALSDEIEKFRASQSEKFVGDGVNQRLFERLCAIEDNQANDESERLAQWSEIEEIRRRQDELDGRLRAVWSEIEGLKRLCQDLPSALPMESFGTLRAQFTDLKREFEAEVLYRRGCEGIFGSNGYASMKSQRLGITQMTASADLGSADAQVALARCLRDGIGCSKSPGDFARYARLSAEQHNSYGEARYAYALVNGFGTTRDDVLAVEYARKSADKGNAMGQNQLAFSLDLGIGIDKDPSLALRYYRMSAEQGNSFGQANFGAALYDGNGVAIDVVKGAMLFKAAALQENAYAQALWGQALMDGKGVARDIDRGAEWLMSSADLGSSLGQLKFATCLEGGRGVIKDRARALEYYRMAAAQGNKDAVAAVERLAGKKR